MLYRNYEFYLVITSYWPYGLPKIDVFSLLCLFSSYNELYLYLFYFDLLAICTEINKCFTEIYATVNICNTYEHSVRGFHKMFVSDA